MVHFRPLRRTSSDFFLFGLIEELRLIIDFIRSMGSLGPVVHTTLKEFKNAPITGRIIFLFQEISAREITCFSWSYRGSVHTKTQSRRFQIPPVWTNRRKEAVCVYKFLRESVDGQSGANHNVTEHHQTRVFNEQTKGCAIVFSKPLCIS